jgi:hypothetical protein
MIAMPESFSFGNRYFTVLDAEAERHGRKLTRSECIALLDQFAATQGILRKKKPKGAARARNPLFDALALGTGTRDLSQLTRAAAKAIAVALADIQAVTPDLTVDEINRRAAAYKRRWTDPRNLSAPALAKHWGQFATLEGEGKTRAALFDVYQEPKNWREAAEQLDGAEIADLMVERGWMNLGPDIRRAILSEIRKSAAAAST